MSPTGTSGTRLAIPASGYGAPVLGHAQVVRPQPEPSIRGIFVLAAVVRSLLPRAAQDAVITHAPRCPVGADPVTDSEVVGVVGNDVRAAGVGAVSAGSATCIDS